MPLSYIKLFSAMEWVLRLDELPGKMVDPTLVTSAQEKPEFIKRNSFTEHLQCIGHRA